ncbi:MAG: KEOPS complex subunit Pcc1 [Thermoplasmata archaeon]
MNKGIRCKLSFYYELLDQELVLAATSIDNYDFVNARVEKNKLVCEISAGTVNSLLNTLNDLLSAIKLAETIYML